MNGDQIVLAIAAAGGLTVAVLVRVAIFRLVGLRFRRRAAYPGRRAGTAPTPLRGPGLAGTRREPSDDA